MDKMLSCLFGYDDKKSHQEAWKTSLIAALCVLAASGLSPVLLEISSPVADTGLGAIIGLSMAVVVLLLFVLAIFAPAVWLGYKRGWKVALISIAMEAAWLVAIALLFLFVTLPAEYR